MSIELEDIARLRLQPGDTLVLRCRHRISQDVLSRLSAAMREAFPDHRTVVLEGGMELEVVEGADSVS